MFEPDLSNPAWLKFQSDLRGLVSDATYRLWLTELTPCQISETRLVLRAPDQAVTWLNNRFGRTFTQAARKAFGSDVEVVITADDIPTNELGREQDCFNPKYNFDQFVIGPNNQLAHAATLAVAELPSQAYNPLFLYAPPGLGKTHLLHSVANYINQHTPQLSVVYSTADAFTNAFLSGLKNRSIAEFKQRYRHADVLLIDDVQFLQEKAKTEEEFFHTFNALYENGSQLVITSDRLPRELNQLEDRLRERFEAGLVADIGVPDFRTRMTILRKRALQDELNIEDESALEVIARAITGNIRTLEGALIRVVAFGSLTGKLITADLADEVLTSLYPNSRSTTPTIEAIQLAVCEAFSVSLSELISASRSSRLNWPRQMGMYLARQLTDHSLPTIGRQFGNRNHSTVMHACRRAETRIKTDPNADRSITKIIQQLSVDNPSAVINSN